MSASRFFLLKPLSLALKLLSIAPLLVISDQAMARFVDGSLEPVFSIDESTPLDNYVVFNGAIFNATEKSKTLDISVARSTLNLTGAIVDGGSANGIHLDSSTATIIGGTVDSDRTGLVLSHDTANTTGSTADVSNAKITGGRNGATVNGLSVLSLSNSTVIGKTFAGIRMFNGTVNATQGSKIVGATSGVQLNADPGVAGPNTLNISGSRVEGLNGASISSFLLLYDM